MSLLARLTEKSWQTPGEGSSVDPASYRPAAVQVGLYVYFAVAATIFLLLVMAYLMRMDIHSAMGHASDDWRPMPEPALLWVNSGLLVLSSLAWEIARRGEGRTRHGGVMAGGLLGLAFLAGQLLLWRQFQAAGYYLSSNPANAFFYLLTGVHGLHLMGGIVGWQRVLVRPTRLGIRLCAIYWHFLLLVWVLLVGLLLST